MRLRYAVLAAGIAALSIGTGPAWALGELGQTAGSSIGTVQVGQVDVVPATAVSAPVDVNAPVTVLGQGGGDASQGSTNSSADTGTSQSGGGGDQTATRSAGTVQVGNVGLSPATEASAPVTANAPVTVLGQGGGNASQGSTNSSADTGTSQSGGGGEQTATRSIGTVQVGQVEADPATALSLSANVNAPVTALDRGESASESRGGSQSTAAQSGGTESTGTQSEDSQPKGNKPEGGQPEGSNEPEGNEPEGSEPDGKGPETSQASGQQPTRSSKGAGLLRRLLHLASSMTTAPRAVTGSALEELSAVAEKGTSELLECSCSAVSTLLGWLRG